MYFELFSFHTQYTSGHWENSRFEVENVAAVSC